MSFNIIVKNYDHYNRTLGKRIRTRRQYEDEMKRQGYISKEEGDYLADKLEEKRNNFTAKLSPKAQGIMEAAKARADKKGNVKLGDKTIDAMKELGMQIDLKHCPKHYMPEGGFE